jgi:hypothetical protein
MQRQQRPRRLRHLWLHRQQQAATEQALGMGSSLPPPTSSLEKPGRTGGHRALERVILWFLESSPWPGLAGQLVHATRTSKIVPTCALKLGMGVHSDTAADCVVTIMPAF